LKRKNDITETPAENVAAAEESVNTSAEAAEVPAEEVSAEIPAEPVKAEKQPSAVKEAVKITLPLSIICIVVALMLAVVNALTADTIAANNAREKEAAILSIFPDGDGTELNYAEDGTEVYRVKTGESVIGYCVSVAENGFGGAVSMMVGVDPSGSVCGVKIVSLSETPGIGSKVKSDGFLATFKGDQLFVIGENFDAISGATVSSKAVVRGVNRALIAVRDTFELETPKEEVQMQLPTVDNTAETGITVETAPAAETTQVISTETVQTERPVVNLAAVLPYASVTSAGKTVNRVFLAGSETVVIEETTAPPETEAPPAETVPPETTAAETLPAETNPAVSETTEVTPVETTPADSAPAIL